MRAATRRHETPRLTNCAPRHIHHSSAIELSSDGTELSMSPHSLHKRTTTMARYAVETRTVNEAVSGGGLLVVAQWEAKDGEADRVADILSRFLPEAQQEPGAQMFLISRARDNPAQFLFYELFRDEPPSRRIRRASTSRRISRSRLCRCWRDASGCNMG
jgi:hypothetical protein